MSCIYYTEITIIFRIQVQQLSNKNALLIALIMLVLECPPEWGRLEQRWSFVICELASRRNPGHHCGEEERERIRIRVNVKE